MLLLNAWMQTRQLEPDAQLLPFLTGRAVQKRAKHARLSGLRVRRVQNMLGCIAGCRLLLKAAVRRGVFLCLFLLDVVAMKLVHVGCSYL